ISILSAIFGLAFAGAASAANITIYHSPHCPHCHHAREFISSTLIYEYPELQVTEVNVMEPANQEKFQEAWKKCEFESGGVPVLVIGDKCEQGYADFMQDTLRQHIEIDLSDEQKAVAAENKKALAEDAEKFKSEHADRVSAISEYAVAPVANEQQPVAQTEKKTNQHGNTIWFWGLLIVLVAGLGYVLVRGDNKKK
ncbi:MAG: hypothetical protein II208_03975, partial [Alphaproteobacteria bacterium]|nr:hypothetical protein [Alphaproteobacteria bacterium]